MKTAALNVSEALLDALHRNQQALVILPGPVRDALGALEDLADRAGAQGLAVEARRSNGSIELRLQGRSGKVRFMARRQISYGQLRGLSLDLVLHSDSKLLPDIVPCLLVRRGIAVNYLSGQSAGPGLADADATSLES